MRIGGSDGLPTVQGSGGGKLAIKGRSNFYNDGVLQLNKIGDTGSMIDFSMGATKVGTIGSGNGYYLDVLSNGGNFRFGSDNTARWSVDTYRMYPVTDNIYDIGLASNRIKNVYASQEISAGRYVATDTGLTSTQGQFREHHYWGSWSSSQSRTHVLEGGNYSQYEVVYTCYRTNGGADNNIYIRGIWTSNHTSHHWKELENVGFVEGNTFTIAASAASPSTTSTRLTITKSAGGGQGGWSMKVTAIGANSGNPTHTVT
jgi:hypothetical protein